MPEGMEGMGDFNDIFNVWPEPGAGGGQSPNGSPHRPEGSPHGGDGGGSGLNHDGPGSPFPCSNTPRVSLKEKVFIMQITYSIKKKDKNVHFYCLSISRNIKL